jgi:hypothetical protein
MDFVRHLILPSVLVLGTACSTLGETKADEKPVVTKSAGLSEQNLETGECAVFLWAASGKREFVYFQKQDSATGKYYRDETTMVITTGDNTSSLGDARSLDFAYTGPAGEKIIVTGGYGGEIEGGLKIAPATIKIETKDGWEQITPATGVFACL